MGELQHPLDVNNTRRSSMDLDCMQLLMIACVFSIDIFNVSSTLSPLDHYTGLQSVSIPQFIHPCIQSSEQTAVQPAQALSQSRWVVRTNHRCSPMLWLASVPAALTPSYFFSVPSPRLTHSFDYISPLPLYQFFGQVSALSPFLHLPT